MMAGRKVVNRNHLRNFKETKRHKVAALQVLTALMEGKYRHRPLQTEDLRDLFLGGHTEMAKPFPQPAGARVSLGLQCSA